MGQSLLEYMTLIVFILGAFLVMQKYIVRGFSGRWKDIGDSVGYGRLYDPHTTTSCAFDYIHYNEWYSVNKFEANGCAEKCFLEPESIFSAACRECICSSQSEACGGIRECK